MLKIPFSGYSKIIGLQKYVHFTKHIPNRIMFATLLKGSPFHPRPNHTKDALYSTSGWGKESEYYASFWSVKSEFV